MKGQTIEVKGPKGTQTFTATDDVTITVNDDGISVTPRGSSKRARQQWGMSRTVVANLVHGVQNTFKKELEIQGVGYRAQVQGNSLKLNLGYSHDVDFAIPQGITNHVPQADGNHRRGSRHPAGRSGRREHPRLAPPRAVQREGYPLQGRVHLPEGRQEEVRTQGYGKQ